MTWKQRYYLRHYLHDAMWIGPILGIIAAILIVRAAFFVDRMMGWRMDFNPDAARTVVATLASSMFTFVVFLSSALLIALQLASAQLTPRIIAIVFRDRLTKAAMTLFVFTFTLTAIVTLRIGDWVPRLTVWLAKYSCILSLAVFLILIDHIGKMLRPSGVLRTVALLGRNVIESVYPRPLAQPRPVAGATPAGWTGGEPACSIPSRKDGVILACDIAGIVALAQHADRVLELVPHVGDFVAKGTPLFHLYGDGLHLSADELRQTVAIGQERSLEQDPAFAFRIIVDIACKALSPAINDPTTAVLAIDQVHHLLRSVGSRQLDDERVRDATGRIRLLYRTPGWEDYVHLAITEIRQYGCQSIQVNRRLRAMLQGLIQVLPDERAQALRKELELLNHSIARSFGEPDEQAMAATSDSQGVGGEASGDDVLRRMHTDPGPEHQGPDGAPEHSSRS
jgi:uncharacterized membrane protein